MSATRESPEDFCVCGARRKAHLAPYSGCDDFELFEGPRAERDLQDAQEDRERAERHHSKERTEPVTSGSFSAKMLEESLDRMVVPREPSAPPGLAAEVLALCEEADGAIDTDDLLNIIARIRTRARRSERHAVPRCPECKGDLGGVEIGRIEEHRKGCSRLPL